MNSMYLPFEDLHNAVHQYFPNDQYIMSQKYALVKKIYLKFKRPMDFTVTEKENFINTVSDSKLLPTIKKLPLVSPSILPKRNIHNCLKRLLKIPGFFELKIYHGRWQRKK